MYHLYEPCYLSPEETKLCSKVGLLHDMKEMWDFEAQLLLL